MDKIIQICPIGLEIKRVISGINFHPPNLVYLLSSYVKKENMDEKKKRLVELSQKFTQSIKDQIYPAKVFVKPCSFIHYESNIKYICDVVKEIYQDLDGKDSVKAIWFNVGTATKLFAIAATHFASFNTELFRLFYVTAENYTINLLDDKTVSKEKMLEIYKKDGITYSKENGVPDYDVIDIPIVPTEKIGRNSRNIMIYLLGNMNPENFKSNWISYTDLLKALESDFTSLNPEKVRALKMKYRHYILRIMNKQLIEDKKHGKQKSFRLTKRGVIVAMILSCLEEVGLINE